MQKGLLLSIAFEDPAIDSGLKAVSRLEWHSLLAPIIAPAASFEGSFLLCNDYMHTHRHPRAPRAGEWSICELISLGQQSFFYHQGISGQRTTAGNNVGASSEVITYTVEIWLPSRIRCHHILLSYYLLMAALLWQSIVMRGAGCNTFRSFLLSQEFPLRTLLHTVLHNTTIVLLWYRFIVYAIQSKHINLCNNQKDFSTPSTSDFD